MSFTAHYQLGIVAIVVGLIDNFGGTVYYCRKKEAVSHL